jgi:putative DNA-invertase from lambdoid prophage Rac
MKAIARVYGYCRVSTQEQATNGESLDTQKQQITGYAMIKGWTIAGFFIETGVSGSVPLAERPEGARLIAAVAKGDAIISPKLDRMFRSASDALATLEELKAEGIALHLIDLGGDVTGNGIGKLTFTILAAVSENERDRIRERIRDVKRHLASQGVYGGGKRPFGFDVVDKRLVPNANEQAALARGRALRDAGKTYRDIADAWVSELGMPKLDAKSIQRMLSRAAES